MGAALANYFYLIKVTTYLPTYLIYRPNNLKQAFIVDINCFVANVYEKTVLYQIIIWTVGILSSESAAMFYKNCF